MSETDSLVEIVVAREHLDVLRNPLWKARHAEAALVVGPLGAALTFRTQDMLMRFPLSVPALPALSSERICRCDIGSWRRILDSLPDDVHALQIRLERRGMTVGPASGSQRWHCELAEESDANPLDREDGLAFALKSYRDKAAETAGQGFVLPVAALSRLIELTAFARANERARYSLDQVLLEPIESGRGEDATAFGLRMAGSDGKRLALATLARPLWNHKAIGGAPLPVAVALPRFAVAGIETLLAACDDVSAFVRVALDVHGGLPRQLTVSIAHTGAVLRIAGGLGSLQAWPPYRQILPDMDDYEAKLSVNASELRECVARALMGGNNYDDGCEQTIAVSRLNDEDAAVTLQNVNKHSETKAVSVMGARVAALPDDPDPQLSWDGSYDFRYMHDAAAAWRSAALPLVLNFNLDGLDHQMMVWTGEDRLAEWWYGLMPMERS